MSIRTDARILLLDVETSPHQAWVWSLWRQTVHSDALIQPGALICYSAKWLHEPAVFDSIHHSSRAKMLRGLHKLLDAAEIVVTYNGRKFDIPIIQQAFAQARLKPPAPFAQVDLLREVRKEFRFPSNKLDYVARAFAQRGKAKHEGLGLWLKCLAGDAKAWAQMERYNRRDVMELEKLYLRLLPWIRHPNLAMILHRHGCPSCGAKRLEARGEQISSAGRYQRFQCKACGKWCRERRTLLTSDESRQIPRHI